MVVTVDGVVFGFQKRGGISRIFNEILPWMCELDPDLFVLLSIESARSRHLPLHPRIRIIPTYPAERWLRPHRFLKRYHRAVDSAMVKMQIGSTRNKIWHSTYYTQKPGWRGPQVVSVYDLIHEKLFARTPEIDAFLRRKEQSIRQAKHLICISQATAREVVETYGIPGERISVIYPAISEVFFANRDGELTPSIDTPFILFVGNREKQYKGFSTLLEVYARWPHRSDIDLLIVGDPLTEMEIQAIDKLGIDRGIRTRVNCEDEELNELYRRAVCLVYPSLAEGFGIPLVEAMASGCPIVASNIPSTVEVAGELPFYFHPGDQAGLSHALDAVLTDPHRARRKESGLARSRAFRWETAAERTLMVYRSL